MSHDLRVQFQNNRSSDLMEAQTEKKTKKIKEKMEKRIKQFDLYSVCILMFGLFVLCALRWYVPVRRKLRPVIIVAFVVIAVDYQIRLLVDNSS